MAQPVRTFVAVEVPPEIRDRAAKLIKELQKAEVDVRWVRPEQMHWTLAFLGNVDLLEVPAVCDAVIDAARPLAPFELVVGGAGAFPNASDPRTIWLGAGEGTESMRTLHAAIEQNLAQLGYRPEGRQYRPHLTLGRLRDRAQSHRCGRRQHDSAPGRAHDLVHLLTQRAAFDAGAALIDEVVVMSSSLGRDGPTYEPLGHAPLAAR